MEGGSASVSPSVGDSGLSDVTPVIPATSQHKMPALLKAERKILSFLWDTLESLYVPIYNGKWKLRTISMNKESKETPLVLLHGMGAGVGLWALNLMSFANVRPVHAIDLLGFGQSSRPDFPKDAMSAESEFVESIEEWRKSMKLDEFTLLGHSLGGFLAASYAIRYPDRVKHLILADPWGFPKQAREEDKVSTVPCWVKAVVKVMQPFNPFSVLRAAGPFGPGLVRRFRSDLTAKFAHLFTDNTVPDYVYHCNVQKPSGEVAFKSLNEGMGFAKHPMIDRITEIPAAIPMTFLYGAESWVDADISQSVKYLRKGSFVDVQVIEGAGHHVYADQADLFNLFVQQASSGERIESSDPSISIMDRQRKQSLRSLERDIELTSVDGSKVE